MIGVCYFGSAVLTGIAGWSLNKAIKEGNFVKELETGVNSAKLKGDAETTYAAIVCKSIGNPQPTLLPSDGKEVLLGRISIKDSTTNIGTGVGPVFGSGHMNIAVTTTSTTSEHTLQFGFPEQAQLNSKFGPVVANNLDLAIWDGAEKDVRTCSPSEATTLLRSLGCRANHSADTYEIIREWYANDEVTIFANVTKKGSVYEINPTERKMPFIVTSQKPAAFVGQVRAKVARFQGISKICALGAGILGVGAFAMQKMMESDERKRWLK